MTRDDFLEGIRPELLSLATPVPTVALRERILASRDAGVRVILPSAPTDRRMPSRLAIGAAIAAALLLLLVPLELRRRVGDADLKSPSLFGQAALAQTARTHDHSGLAPVRLTVPERLRPLTLELERRVADSAGGPVRVSHMSLSLAAAFVDNVPAWRVQFVQRDTLPRRAVAVETVFVARADVRLLRRTIHVAPYRRFQRINVWQDFPGSASDSVTGHMNTEGPSIGAGRTFARKLPGEFGPTMTESIAPVFLVAAQLTRDWSGGASLLGWAVRDDDVVVPMALRVEGEETITVPAGRFDCWRLSLSFDGRQVAYWVRKRDGLGVRVLDRHGAREIVLTRIAP